ncbi:RNA methyltransferase [Hymenobacter sp. 15J16-1T3B]|uniref:RNA methyltransferase n=1 Tax=Hymenobacter sp. 15J16-1T3B TaxID=2886941 RepID=UPI001D0F7709|nr:RNA methyltransferase [Hymenobacter sp. 15J16-1T3B]MCC3159003.1 RNA methyltransferase [Hymenobacter sp. 15J16-1T3B]
MVSKAVAKYVQQLHQKKYRQRLGAFLVEGAKSLRELLSSELQPERLLLTAEFAAQPGLRLPPGVPVDVVSGEELTRLGTLQTNDAGLAIVRTPDEPPLRPQPGQLLLALDQVRDPGNVGTLIRLADWYGLPGVVLSDTCADAWNPKTVAATMGSFTRVPVWQRDLPAWLGQLPAELPVYGADLHGDNVHRLQLRPTGVLVMGSESHGLTEPVEACLTQRLHIPGRGQAESLNVAISAAILLDNFFRGE